MEHNIEKEKKLIDLLGYHVVGPDNSNRWLIMDENQNEVGFIQYKKIHNKHKIKGDAVFGYITEIESDKIQYSATKKLGKEEVNDMNYKFHIKQDNGDKDYVEMSLGQSPSITIWSQTHHFMNFHIDYKGLYFEFKSQTEHYNVEEVLLVRIPTQEQHRNSKSYAYTLSYCDKSKEITETKGKRTYDIEFMDKTSADGKLDIKDIRWKNGIARYCTTSTVEGTVLEAIQKHKMGIDAFAHFKYLINKIVPFQEEVITSIVKERGITEPEYLLFFPELEQPQMTSVGETIEEQGPIYVK